MTTPTADDLRSYDPVKDKDRIIGWFWRFLLAVQIAGSGRWTIKGRFRRLIEFERTQNYYVLILTCGAKQAMIFWERQPFQHKERRLWGWISDRP